MSAINDSARSSPRSLSWQFSWGFAAAFLAIGLLQSISELQHYLAQGGQHPWEPFLWELSSTSCTSLLAPLIFRLHQHSLSLKAWPQRLGLHLGGALLYPLLHVGGMFGLRLAVYALAGVSYEPGSAGEILAYEVGKDWVSYAIIVGLCHAVLLHHAHRQREQDLLRLQAELAEARLARLAEQIQPHFLFNTLNLISSVMYEDVAQADRILCDLAALLRQALTAQQSPRHTLAQEVALVRPYLSIMQARFGERLSVSIELSEDAQRCLLPSLLLIAPVENAITHDVAQSSGPVRVSLQAEVIAGQLHLRVHNSGTAPQRQHREGAVGMSNTRERLQSLYGERAQVTLQPHPEGGTLLRLQLPAEMETKA
ncbi:sensor histidine kinase [Paucibacter sp. Y2R2-4]|uniref:sensor histidine kinase n=1 Tax=Paucibacter sp. Y2R2-4 TaxID=2893553 RepID=UPI0021E39295|nr:histidine kinase [Paucibacter sp. Y2R2-4]MCV2351208.1 histidine kinase [Paucibacter sp. Y2R2-4]